MAAAVRPDPRPRYVRFVVLTPRAGGGYEVPTLICPRGHRIDANGGVRTFGDGLYTCRAILTHRTRNLAGKAMLDDEADDIGGRWHRCGLTLYVLAGIRSPTGAPAWYYVHVTEGELAKLEQMGLSPDEVMRHLSET